MGWNRVMPEVVRGTRTEPAEFFADFRAWPRGRGPHPYRGKGSDLQAKVPIRYRIEAVFADALEAEFGRNRFAVDGIRGSG